MTEKLFYQDSHMVEFDAEVVSCVPSGEKWEVVLDRTAFFPEGGGQSSDTGKINEIQVVDVQEKEGVICHTTDGKLEVGSRVHGVIDWGKRFDNMQQHTGEHIVSGLIHKTYGYDNVGFHLGDAICTLDLNGPIDKEQLAEIENAANEVVFANLPIEASYPSKEQLEQIEYRSKIEIEGQVRIVTVPGVDVCACCAPHVKTTGEIGLIKFVQMQNYKGGVRITMLCGRRALADFQKKEALVKSIMFQLSSKEELIAEAVGTMKAELNEWKEELLRVERKYLSFRAKAVVTGEDPVLLFENGLSGQGPRELMNLVMQAGAPACAVFAGEEEAGYRYVIGSKEEDVRALAKELNQELEGRGGGKPEMVQGSVKATADQICSFMERKGFIS